MSATTLIFVFSDKIKLNCTIQISDCVKVQKTLKKPCIITGLPEPNVTVSKITETALSKRLPSAHLSGLTFSDVALTDRGTYRVTAKNILQEISSDIAVRTGVEICCEFTVRLLNLVLDELCSSGTCGKQLSYT